ncbi:hypothetical protein CcaverHIS002_0504930 [Cutaneotrichosporon cavernicola]|nr:hypothetical protein CcaverHIS002_0504930 [Cutaneotrichosporon cavernicola]
MQDPSQGLYSDSQTQSTYPPTGPATFPSPAQNAATVLDRSATPSSSRPILGSPTSQTRTSLHGRRDSVQQSFSQLRMFAHKFETARGSPEQPRPSATPQVNTTAASPPQSWAQQPQVTTASSTGIPLAHGVQQLWSRQLLTPSGTAPTAQLQAPQGAVSPPGAVDCAAAKLVPISASQVSTPRKAVNISSGHSEGYVRREEMAGAGPVYVIAKASERVWNSQHSQSSQDPQAAQPRGRRPSLQPQLHRLPASQPPKIGRPPGTGKLQIAAGGEREAACCPLGELAPPQTGTLASTSNGTSKTPVASPSALDAPGPQAAAHAQPKRIGPINRAMVVVPISRTRREQLIARGVYDPFRDDADPYLEPERVSRRPRAAQTYPVTKIISASISRGTAQRIREPEVIKDRFAHPPEPPMREPFKSVLARDSLLNRLGNYVCEWKGCEAEMASESKLLRHVLARNHAGQAAFTFGNLELYKCYWGNCDSASFRTAGKLEQHMLAMHVCEKLVCPYEDCHLRSSTISHLYRHVVRNHEDGDQPRPRVDCPSEAALSPPEALPASIATVELTTLPALGKSYRTERYQELAHAKVLKMCVAPENPEIHVVHPLHMLEVIGNEDENIAETREASPQGGKRGDAEEETEEERETPSEEIVLLVEAAIVQDPLQRKRKDASLPGPDGGTKRAMARRTGGDPVTPRSSQRVATQRKVKTEAVRITRRQTARRTGAVGSPIPVSDGSSRGSKDNGQGGRGDSKGVEWARSGRGRGQRMVIECIEVPRIDTSGYQRMDK